MKTGAGGCREKVAGFGTQILQELIGTLPMDMLIVQFDKALFCRESAQSVLNPQLKDNSFRRYRGLEVPNEVKTLEKKGVLYLVYRWEQM